MSFSDSIGKPRTLAILLAIAVALNLFLAGILAGRLSADRVQGPQLIRGLEHQLARVPPQERRRMLQQVRAMLPQMRERHRTLGKLHESLAEELSTEHPDRARLEASLAEIRSQVLATQTALHTAFLDTALELPREKRLALLQGVLRHRGGMPGPGSRAFRRRGGELPPMEGGPDDPRRPPQDNLPPDSPLRGEP